MGGYQRTGARAALGEEAPGDIRIVRRPEERGDVQPECGGGDRQQLEVAGMRGEDDEWTRVLEEIEEDGDSLDLDAVLAVALRVEVEDLVEEDVFGREPGHADPHFEGDRLALLVALAREGIPQIRKRELVAGRQRPDAAGERVDHLDRPVEGETGEDAEEGEEHLRYDPVACTPDGQDETRDEKLHLAPAQPIFRTILPKT